MDDGVCKLHMYINLTSSGDRCTASASIDPILLSVGLSLHVKSQDRQVCASKY